MSEPVGATAAFDEAAFDAYLAEHRAETVRLNVYGRIVAALLGARGDSRFGSVLAADVADSADVAVAEALAATCAAIAAIARDDAGQGGARP